GCRLIFRGLTVHIERSSRRNKSRQRQDQWKPLINDIKVALDGTPSFNHLVSVRGPVGRHVFELGTPNLDGFWEWGKPLLLFHKIKITGPIRAIRRKSKAKLFYNIFGCDFHELSLPLQ